MVRQRGGGRGRRMRGGGGRRVRARRMGRDQRSVPTTAGVPGGTREKVLASAKSAVANALLLHGGSLAKRDRLADKKIFSGAGAAVESGRALGGELVIRWGHDQEEIGVSEHRHTNRLAKETSPYLLQHQFNP